MCRQHLALTALLVFGGCREGAGLVDAVDPLARTGTTTGLDAGLLRAAMEQAEGLGRLRALIVARDGDIYGEHYAGGYGPDQPANIKSLSKSVLSALAGAAIARRVLDGADQPVAPILARDLPAVVDPRLRLITVGHLLSMRAGLESTSGPRYGAWAVSSNPVRYTLARPFVDDPGGRMLYSTGTSHLLSAVLTHASGRTTLQLARDWLGDPMGISIPPWSRDAQGIFLGGNDMALSPRALLSFGEMYRNGGVHVGPAGAAGRDSVRVLPEEWVRASWQSQTRSPWSGFAYGYGWWMRRAGRHTVYFAWGYGGQMLFIVPSLGLTVVILSDPDERSVDGGHLAALHGLLDDVLIPAAERGGQSQHPP